MLDIAQIGEFQARFDAQMLKRFNEWEKNPIPAEGWEFVTEALPQVRVQDAGGIIPFESEGKVGDLNFYFRERSGGASLTLFPAGTNFISKPYTMYKASLPDSVTVWRDNYVEVFEALYQRAERLAPMWEGTATVTQAGDEVSEERYLGRGWSEAEAIQNLRDYHEEQKNRSVADWEEYFGALGYETAAERAQRFYDHIQGRTYELDKMEIFEDVPLETFLAIPEFEDVKIDLRS